MYAYVTYMRGPFWGRTRVGECALDAELARLKREGATIIRIVHDIA